MRKFNRHRKNKILEESSEDDDDSGCAIDELYYYSWIPLKTKNITNSSSLNLNKIIKYQLPLQDFSKNFCLNIKNKKEYSEFKEFIVKRKQNYFGQGIPKKIVGEKVYCRQCKSPIESKTLAITAITHFGVYAHWHPNCFVCLIFGEECTEAEGKTWHLNHFCCIKCNQPLAGCQYVMKILKENKKEFPFCLSCCQNISSNNYCATCFVKIPSDYPHIVAKRALIGLPYSLINNQLFCNYSKTINWKQKPPSFSPPPPLPINGPPPLPPSFIKRSSSSENFYETVAPSMPKRKTNFEKIFGTNKSTPNLPFSSFSVNIKKILNNVENSEIKNPRKTFSKQRSKSMDGYQRKKDSRFIKEINENINNEKYSPPSSPSCTLQINNNFLHQLPTSSRTQKNSFIFSSESEITDNEEDKNNLLSSESDVDDDEQFLSANARFLHHYFAIAKSESIRKNNLTIPVNNLSVLTKNRDESKKHVFNCHIS
uniref:LIM zinc-binding domain-containing protein n=1 Tax=Meloidogyne floridensis TaxID=298350 RepID=A0A915PBC0_9BILA